MILDGAIRRIQLFSTRISNDAPRNSIHSLESELRPPESSEGDDADFVVSLDLRRQGELGAGFFFLFIRAKEFHCSSSLFLKLW